MRKINLASCGALTLAALLAGGCTSETANNNANLNSNATTTTTANTATTNTAQTTDSAQGRTAPDDSEIQVTEAGGVRTETRTFKGENRRVERVVVTTRDGKRTARVYSRTGEVKDLPDNQVERALDATGDALSDAAGFVVDKSKDAASATKEGVSAAADKAGDAASATKEGAEKVIDKTGGAAKTVGEKTVEGAKTVGEKTVEGAKTAGKKTAEGAKKAGSAIKDAVTP